jgi:uncharacterized protein (TIGR02246 family)
MKNYSIPMTACVLTLFLAGCNQAPPPAPDTREADAKAIRDGADAWSKDWAAKDVNKIVAHYADDAALMIAGMAQLNGRAAISSALTEMLKDPNMTLSFGPTLVEVSKASDIAYEQGTYSMTMTDPKSKKVVTEKGKYVTVYKKQAAGEWKAVADINNADAAGK